MNKLDDIHTALTFDDVLIKPKHSQVLSRNQPLNWKLGKYHFFHPIIPANMDTISGVKMLENQCKTKGLGIHHRYSSLQEYSGLRHLFDRDASFYGPLALSVGSIHSDQERIDWCIDNADIICLDIAHADSIHASDTLNYIRRQFTGPIIAGNVCTPEGTRFLLEHGATMVKVGVGPGSVCTTRIKTGCGYPQLEAIARCAEMGPIIADGGIKTPGDAAKALAAGASAVMIGGMFAGTDCVPGWDEAQKQVEDILKRYPTGPERDYHLGRDFVVPQPRITYRGMASNEARAASGQQAKNAEGVSKTITCKPVGSTTQVLEDLFEGIRSAMSYNGSETLNHFARTAEFVRVTSSSQVENHPHFSG
jgi:IMP dehydrogenase/GMP reductase